MLRSIVLFLMFLPISATAQDAPAVPSSWFSVSNSESAIVLNLYQTISPQVLDIYGDDTNPYTYLWNKDVRLLTQFRVPPGRYDVILPFDVGSVTVDAKPGQISLIDFTALSQKDFQSTVETVSAESLQDFITAAGSGGYAIDPSIFYMSPESSVIDIRARMPPGVKPPPRPDPPPG